MATISGRGLCEIPQENERPCARQIQEGEPHGSVYVGRRYLQGHKRCADAFHARKAAKEREERMAGVVQRMNQDGPGGPVDFSGSTDALEGGVPIVTRVDENSPPAAARLADLPMDATPEEAVAFAKGEELTLTADEARLGGGPRPMTLEERVEVVRKRREGGEQRHVYHQANAQQQQRMERIRALGAELDATITDFVPQSTERDAALHYVDLAVMCSNAGISRHG